MTDQSRADIYGSRARIGDTSPPLTTEVFDVPAFIVIDDNGNDFFKALNPG
jgi:hypothetical protein